MSRSLLLVAALALHGCFDPDALDYDDYVEQLEAGPDAYQVCSLPDGPVREITLELQADGVFDLFEVVLGCEEMWVERYEAPLTRTVSTRTGQVFVLRRPNPDDTAGGALIGRGVVEADDHVVVIP